MGSDVSLSNWIPTVELTHPVWTWISTNTGTVAFLTGFMKKCMFCNSSRINLLLQISVCQVSSTELLRSTFGKFCKESRIFALIRDGDCILLGPDPNFGFKCSSTRMQSNFFYSLSAPLRLYSSCSHDGQCPTHATCKYRFPRGQVCYCDAGYVSSLDALQCEPGK